jgi:Domain of unknown function (DUF4159)
MRDLVSFRFGAMVAVLLIIAGVRTASAGVTSEEVDRAIDQGVRYLKQQQQADGSWLEIDANSKTGTTSLATLALLAAGEKPGSAAIDKALEFLRRFGANQINNTYAVALQTMVFAAADPQIDQLRIVDNAAWLERTQIKPGDNVPWPGSWSYFEKRQPGDNSNTQYGLLGLDAARHSGVPIKSEVWSLARSYWENGQKVDGSWAYTPEKGVSTASMTCAGVSSLILLNHHKPVGEESLTGQTVQNCGKRVVYRPPGRGLDWLAGHFRVNENFGAGPLWAFYYLGGLERAGRLAGARSIGQNEWFRLGAEHLVRVQDKTEGSWRNTMIERNKTLATSFALMFLAKGRAPVLIKKLRHGPSDDWNNDPGDIPHLVEIIARGRQKPLTWQVADPDTATLQELLETPILFLNGHKALELTPRAKQNLLAYVNNGGFIFAEACCGSADFDQSFRQLMKEVFTAGETALQPLAENHPVWRALHLLTPEIQPLWGFDRNNRTVVIYSPHDLSCFWNNAEDEAANPAVIKAIRVGQNVVEYASGGKILPDKLVQPKIAGVKP